MNDAYPSDDAIAQTMRRLAAGRFNESTDWPVSFRVVRGVVRSHRLSVKFAPTSRYGGADWSDDDFEELAADWIIRMRGSKAAQLVREAPVVVGHRESSAELSEAQRNKRIADSTRKSVYYYVLSQRQCSPATDLYCSISEAVKEKEFTDLLNPSIAASQVDRLPEAAFPWNRDKPPSERRRYVSVTEVREALNIVRRYSPDGWTVRRIFDLFLRWAAIPQPWEVPLQILSNFEPHSPSSDPSLNTEAQGAHVAERILAKLKTWMTAEEIVLFQAYYVPKHLGIHLTLEQLSARMHLPRSTLHDRIKRLESHLSETDLLSALGDELNDLRQLGPLARSAVVQTLCGGFFPESGNGLADESINT